ncbi:MAG: hypothetical protein HY300_05450 [Verrucomicrobia bacterium]|nr:hypothetical protein [Verrucomicrobiota bacterium]
MKTTSPVPFVDVDAFAPLTGPAEFNLVVLYKDAAACRHALETQDNLIAQSGPDCSVNTTWWQFDSLRHADIFEASILAAEQADIIMVAAPEGEPLPPVARVWLDVALGRQSDTGRALVAVPGVTEPPPINTPAENFLRNLASCDNAAFAEQHYDLLPSSNDNNLLNHIHERAETVTPVLEHIFDDAVKHQRWIESN